MVLCMSISIRLSSQLPVTDAAHIVETAGGFILSIEEAVRQLTELSNLFSIGTETLEDLDKLRANYEKVNQWILQMKTGEDAILDLIAMTDMVSNFARTARSAYTTFTPSEFQSMIEQFNQILARATNDLSTLHDCTDGRFLLTDDQRRLCVVNEAKKIKADKEAMDRIAKDIENEQKRRAAIAEAYLKQLLSPAEAVCFEEMAEHSELDMGTIAIKQLTEMIDNFQFDEKTMTDAQATTELKEVSNGWIKVWYAICAIIGLIGAYKVYVKVQLGDDLTKSVWLWFAAALLLAAMGTVVEKFFLS